MRRTIARLAAVAAITGGGAAPFPTLAGDRVYDSRQDAISDIKPNEFKAAIVVRAGEDRWQERAPNGRSLMMHFELSMVRAIKERDGTIVTGWCETDSQIEAYLDLMEYQVRNALWGYGPWANWFNKIVRLFPAEDYTVSSPIYTSQQEGRVRLSARELSVPIILSLDCFQKPMRYGDPSKYPADDLVPLDSTGEPDIPRTDIPADLNNIFIYLQTHATGAVLKMSEGLRRKFEAMEFPPGVAYPLLKTVSYSTPGPETNDLGAPTQTETDVSL